MYQENYLNLQIKGFCFKKNAFFFKWKLKVYSLYYHKTLVAFWIKYTCLIRMIRISLQWYCFHSKTHVSLQGFCFAIKISIFVTCPIFILWSLIYHWCYNYNTVLCHFIYPVRHIILLYYTCKEPDQSISISILSIEPHVITFNILW